VEFPIICLLPLLQVYKPAIHQGGYSQTQWILMRNLVHQDVHHFKRSKAELIHYWNITLFLKYTHTHTHTHTLTHTHNFLQIPTTLLIFAQITPMHRDIPQSLAHPLTYRVKILVNSAIWLLLPLSRILAYKLSPIFVLIKKNHCW